jgi:hypothetical protein
VQLSAVLEHFHAVSKTADSAGVLPPPWRLWLPLPTVVIMILTLNSVVALIPKQTSIQLNKCGPLAIALDIFSLLFPEMQIRLLLYMSK